MADSDFNTWVDWTWFDDDGDDWKTSHPTTTAVTRSEPSSAKSSPTSFDAPTASWDGEPSSTGSTATTSGPDSVHDSELAGPTKTGQKSSKASGGHHHKGRLRLSKESINSPNLTVLRLRSLTPQHGTTRRVRTSGKWCNPEEHQIARRPSRSQTGRREYNLLQAYDNHS